MGQNKEKPILPSIFLICIVLIVFVFVIVQNVVSADNLKNIKYTNSSVSELLENMTNEFITQNIELAQEKYQYEFDVVSDYSFQKYVSDDNILQNKKYEPLDLVLIDQDHIVIRAGRPYLRQAAATAFNQLTDAFYAEFNKEIYIASAYRTYSDQVNLFDGGCSNIRCAKIGASEHQLGLAVDIHIATKAGYMQFSSGYLDWMNENAYKYGFINTYSKGPKIDGKMKEIRHRRYVGVPFATELHEKDMSFAERMKNN